MRPQGANNEDSPSEARAVYRRLAPATVFIRTAHGFGAGVVVGAGGHILTNYHVVAEAEDVNFRQRVTVEFGHIDADGVMIHDLPGREGWVVRIDPARDLAVVKVQDLPAGVVPVSVAREAPSPGQAVVCLGHGSVGLAWSIRSCQIESIGRLSESLGVVMGRCDGSTADTDECSALRRMWARDYSGLVLQSTCGLSPGDSGGPLVNSAGELVGLNVQIIDAGASGSRSEQSRAGLPRASIHIHLRELVAMTADMPSDPLAVLPDPWTLRGTREIGDLDLDGRIDSLMVESSNGDQYGELYDLDGDSPSFRVDQLDQVFERRGFDAEMAYVRHGRDRYTLYDTNNDGRFDLMVKADGISWRIAEAWLLDANGVPTPTTTLNGQPTLSTDRLPEAIRASADRILNDRSADRPMGPFPAVLRQGERADVDGDSINDHVAYRRGPVFALLVDSDQNSLGTLDLRQIDEALQARRVDAEFTLVGDRSHQTLWAWYDRDGDGRHELALQSDWTSLLVHRALLLDADGSSRPLPGFLGTLIAQPELVHAGQSRLRQVLIEDLGANSVGLARDQDLAGLPNPVTHHRDPSVEQVHAPTGWRESIRGLRSAGFNTLLFDLDRRGFRSPARHVSRHNPHVAPQTGLDPEAALVLTDDISYAWYDTDDDSLWDTVLVRCERPGHPTETEAHVRGAAGELEPAPTLADGPLIRPALLRNVRHRRALEDLSRRFLQSRLQGQSTTPR